MISFVSQGQLIAAAKRSMAPSRSPTPGYEYGLLGLGNSQERIQDPRATQDMAMWRINTRPFNEWVTGPWLGAIIQETIRIHMGPIKTPWGK
jgi:hypothetical protein